MINKKAKFYYHLLEEYIAGIQLFGSEVKSIRKNKVNITESFCKIINHELYSINIYIEQYQTANHNTTIQYDNNRKRKLLLTKHELKKIQKKLTNSGSGLTIIPFKLFFSKTGYAKLKIFIAKGKKIYDKREIIKKRDWLKNKKSINIFF
ncbi:SsrA-binding protein SmpB [Blattabacterium cuenoti]|nr:SsrA-binding protein SmpB [Blattabacterium cuenoti]